MAVTAVLSFTKSTKRMYRYDEVNARGEVIEDSIISGIYVRKTALGVSPPARIVITVIAEG